MGNTDVDGPTPTDQSSQRDSTTSKSANGAEKSGGSDQGLLHTCATEPWFNCPACRRFHNYNWHFGSK